MCFSYLKPVCFVFLVYSLSFVLCCQYQCKWLPGKTCLRNDLLLCVDWDVKLYSFTPYFSCTKLTWVLVNYVYWILDIVLHCSRSTLCRYQYCSSRSFLVDKNAGHGKRTVAWVENVGTEKTKEYSLILHFLVLHFQCPTFAIVAVQRHTQCTLSKCIDSHNLALPCFAVRHAPGGFCR